MFTKAHFKKSAALLALLLLLVCLSCNIKQSAMGYQHRIFMVVDSVLWKDLGPQVREGFERTVYTPLTEKTFYIIPIPLKKLSAYKYRMNIFFMGVAGEPNAVDDYLQKILPEEFKKGVDNGGYFYLYQKNLFARDQISLIMYAPNRAAFKERFRKNINKIYRIFEKKYYARLKKSMFDKDEQKKLEQFLVAHYGWKLKIQHDYFLAAQDYDKHYVWLRRMDPDRWISIWQIKADSAMLNMDSLVNVRNRMARWFYGGDKIIKEDSYLQDVDFNGLAAQKLVGLWKNDSLLIGGPCRMYVVPDPLDSVYHLIDIAVMAPEKWKEPYLDQLEVIAHTFEVVK